MPETTCRLCWMKFEYDAHDTCPYLWHEHPGGIMVANDNPNLIRKKRIWHSPNPTKPKKTFWQDWQHFEAKTKIGDEE